VSYVIDPEYERDGTPVVDGMDEDTVFTLLGGGLLLFQLLSIPLWLKLTHWKGKYMAYLVWNVVQVVSIALKIFVTHHSIVAGAIFAVRSTALPAWSTGNAFTQAPRNLLRCSGASAAGALSSSFERSWPTCTRLPSVYLSTSTNSRLTAPSTCSTTS